MNGQDKMPIPLSEGGSSELKPESTDINIQSGTGGDMSTSNLDQSSERKYRSRRVWTSAEDEKLRLLVSHWGDQCGKNGHWDKISSNFEGRSNKDCRKRWFHSLDPKLKRGRWTEHEDKVLVEAYKKMGPVWHRIAQLIPGRTDDQCSKRYNDVLDPRISDRLRPWSAEEDAKLLELVQKHGTKWRTISNVIDGRTGLTCRNRWRKLTAPSVRANAKAKSKSKLDSLAEGHNESLESLEDGAEQDAQQLQMFYSSRQQQSGLGDGDDSDVIMSNGSSPASSTSGNSITTSNTSLSLNNSSSVIQQAQPQVNQGNPFQQQQANGLLYQENGPDGIPGLTQNISQPPQRLPALQASLIHGLSTPQSRQQQPQQQHMSRQPLIQTQQQQLQHPQQTIPSQPPQNQQAAQFRYQNNSSNNMQPTSVTTRYTYTLGDQDVVNAPSILYRDLEALVELAAKSGREIVIHQHNHYHYGTTPHMAAPTKDQQRVSYNNQQPPVKQDQLVIPPQQPKHAQQAAQAPVITPPPPTSTPLVETLLGVGPGASTTSTSIGLSSGTTPTPSATTPGTFLDLSVMDNDNFIFDEADLDFDLDEFHGIPFNPS
ncbi:Bas1p [Sugiyamaella lignohabitans]|uniref:Bas1p n=1 Tax=Sugiyamaella lignohabitans TaxID=796027 RepID=A0A161HX08_9ASCO|nr:Bas1p [Sugiyamaella lignohabitans]ANB13243.1 Bas1p [Sugiyamaella lignohabitans]